MLLVVAAVVTLIRALAFVAVLPDAQRALVAYTKILIAFHIN